MTDSEVIHRLISAIEDPHQWEATDSEVRDLVTSSARAIAQKLERQRHESVPEDYAWATWY